MFGKGGVVIRDEGIITLSAIAGILVLVGVIRFAAYRARTASKLEKKEIAEKTVAESEAHAKAVARERRETKEREKAEAEARREEEKKANEDARSQAKAETESRLKARAELEQTLPQDDLGAFCLEVTAEKIPRPQRSGYTRLQKAQIVTAVRGKILSAAEACERYDVSDVEWNIWIELLDNEIERREDPVFFAEHDAWLPERANVEVKRNANGHIVEIHFDVTPPLDNSAVTIEEVLVYCWLNSKWRPPIDWSLKGTLPMVISATPAHFFIATNTSVEEIRVTLRGFNPSRDLGFEEYIELGRGRRDV